MSRLTARLFALAALVTLGACSSPTAPTPAPAAAKDKAQQSAKPPIRTSGDCGYIIPWTC